MSILGITCPHCGKGDTSVLDSRPRQGARFRRTQCHGCGKRFNTFEFTDVALRLMGVSLPKDPDTARRSELRRLQKERNKT